MSDRLPPLTALRAFDAGQALPATALRGLARARLVENGKLTRQGAREARAARLDERRWMALRCRADAEALLAHDDGLTPLDSLLPAAEIAALDKELR